VPIRVDRRFILFLVLTLLLWGGGIAARFWLFPAPPPEPVAEAPVDPAPEEKPGEKGAEKPVEPEVAPEIKAAPAEAVPAKPTAPEKRVMLGSLGGKQPMLVTFITRGGAVERVELSRFNAIDDDSGYLGHILGGAADPAEVIIVGPGTPAALAKTNAAGIGPGLKVGDVIAEVGIGSKKITEISRRDLERFLTNESRPGQTLTILVTRKGR
jgi:hypothetical protein